MCINILRLHSNLSSKILSNNMDWFGLTSREIMALGTSGLIAVSVSVISVFIGLVLTIIFSTWDFRFKPLLKYIFLTPLFIPSYLHAVIWMNLYWIGLKSGWLDYSILASLRSVSGVIGILSLSLFPLSFLLLQATDSSIPQPVKEAGSLSRAPFLNTLNISLPLWKPAIITSFLITFMLAFTTFDVPAFFETNVFLVEIFTQFSSKFNYARALYLSLIPFVICVIGWSAVLIYFDNRTSLFSASTDREARRVRPSWPSYVLIVLIFLIILVPSVGVPLVSIGLTSHLFTPAFVQDMQLTGPVILNTIVIATSSSIMITLVGCGVFIGWYRKKWGRIVTLSLMSIPAMSFGIFFIALLNRPFFNVIYASPLILICAYSLRFVPLICEVMFSYTLQVNPQYLEAARLSRGVDRRFITAVVMPLYKPALSISVALAFWLVVSELPITLLIQPSGFQTLTSRLYIFLHYGSEELMNTMALLLLGLCFLPVIVSTIFVKQGKRHA